MKLPAAMLLFAASALCAQAVSAPATASTAEQTGPPASQAAEPLPAGEVVFSFVPRLEAQPPWEIRLGQDQSGTYRELTTGDGKGSAGQPLRVSDAVWKRVRTAMPLVRPNRCETRQKGIAQTGVKTFTVLAGTSTATCTFNYSDQDGLNDAASVFVALAETIAQGAKLQRDHRFNKLALDVDMDVLVTSVENGRALEPQNIAPVLQSLIDDDHVIDRVRRKAARLLQAESDKAR